MQQKIYGITAWSNKEFTARKNYYCYNCGELIARGTRYLRHVIRHGERAGKDPLENVGSHLTCEAPWFQVSTKNRLSNLGRLKKLRPVDSAQIAPSLQPVVSMHRPLTGSLCWVPPNKLTHMLTTEPQTATAVAALGELTNALNIVIMAAVEASGNRRKSLALSHLITQIAETITHETTSHT